MRQEWWCSTRNLSDVKRLFGDQNINFLIGATDPQDTHEKVIGFARVLTDYVYKAMIFDVIVAASHRKAGLGRKIIERIIADKKLKDVTSFELYCPESIRPFYEKIGFSGCESTLMIYHKPRID